MQFFFGKPPTIEIVGLGGSRRVATCFEFVLRNKYFSLTNERRAGGVTGTTLSVEG
jgi:hypothetical protein